jgi:hypothetical protein
MEPTNILTFPARPRLSPQDRETLARWAAGLRGIDVRVTAEPEGEYASIIAGSDLFALHRERGEVVVCDWSWATAP